MTGYPLARLRRSRMQSCLRDLFCEANVVKTDLVQLCAWVKPGDAAAAAAGASTTGVRGVYVEAQASTPQLVEELAGVKREFGEKMAVMVDAREWSQDEVVACAREGVDSFTVAHMQLDTIRQTLEASGLHNTMLSCAVTPPMPSSDFTIVKGGLTELDTLHDEAASSTIPTVAHHTDFAMLAAACEKGWLDESRVLPEAVLSFKRAGASFVITPFANKIASAM